MEKRSRRIYSEDFKLSVLIDYYSHGLSKGFTIRKYGLSCKSVFNSWLSRYPIDEVVLSLPLDQQDLIMNRSKKTPPVSSREAELSARIKELEKALAYANLRAEAFDRMIDIAEQQEGIRIRKKPGTKQ